MRRRRAGQVHGECAAHARLTFELDLTPEQPRELSADGKPEAGTAVLSAGRTVTLRKGFENRVLLLGWNADAGVDDTERNDLLSPTQHLVACAPPGGGDLGDELHSALLCELERIAEQVVEDLLQALRIRGDRIGQTGPEIDRE